MFEKYEKWFILAIIAFAVYYFYKKGSMATALPSVFSPANPPTERLAPGSLVNTYLEPGTLLPAQSSGPTVFSPAQPATVPISQRVVAGEYTYGPVPPVLRITSPTGGVRYQLQ